MDFDWERLQKKMNEAAMGEKISADIEKKYATLVNDLQLPYGVGSGLTVASTVV